MSNTADAAASREQRETSFGFVVYDAHTLQYIKDFQKIQWATGIEYAEVLTEAEAQSLMQYLTCLYRRGEPASKLNFEIIPVSLRVEYKMSRTVERRPVSQ